MAKASGWRAGGGGWAGAAFGGLPVRGAGGDAFHHISLLGEQSRDALERLTNKRHAREPEVPWEITHAYLRAVEEYLF